MMARCPVCRGSQRVRLRLFHEFSVADVAPQNVATMQERIEERQMQVAALVVEEAQRQVDHWGSDFHWTSLTKYDAGRLIRESLGRVKKQLAEWKRWT